MSSNRQFFQASKDGDLENVKKMIRNGVNVHFFVEEPLCFAAQNGHLEVVKYLISNGAHHHTNHALRWAAFYGHLEVVKYLVSKENDIHADDEKTLRLAAYNGRLDIVKYLVEECGADVHAYYDDGALRWAVNNGHLDVVKYLKSYIVSQFTKKHIDKQKRIEKSNQVFKEIRALPGIGIDYLYAFENFNHLKTIY